MVPVLMVPSSRRPRVGSLSRIRLRSALIRLVTIQRARSECEATRRSRPPSPTAADSCSLRSSISSRTALGSAHIVVALRIFQLLAKIGSSATVLSLGPCIQQRTAITETRDDLALLKPNCCASGNRVTTTCLDCGSEVECQKLLSGIAQEMGDVVESFGVLQAYHLPAIRQIPIVGLPTEYGRFGCDHALLAKLSVTSDHDIAMSHRAIEPPSIGSDTPIDFESRTEPFRLPPLDRHHF